MKTQIETTFSKCLENKCLETRTEERFWVNDFEENPKCELCLIENAKNHFEIENLSKKEIHFLAIDHCIFDDSDEEKCDFAIFDVERFCWVEIKTAGKSTRRKSRKKAIEQLRNTVKQFKSKLDFSTVNRLEANICIHSEKDTYPQKSATNLMEIKRFQDELGVRLTEGNKKIFN